MSTAELVRTFIALDVPAELKGRIETLQGMLRGVRGARVAWTRSEGIHLTLKFLGDVPRDRIEAVVDAVGEATGGFDPIRLITTGLGSFPNLKRPRVLWLGVDGGERLLRLQARVEASLEGLGFPREGKRFHPHLTVGRVKALDRGSELMQLFTGGEIDETVWEAGEVRVMSSRLRPTSAEYSVLAVCPFKSGPMQQGTIPTRD